MSIEDFKMYEEWSRYREEAAAQPAVAPPKPMVLASWGSRLGAYLIDGILLGIPMMFFMWEQMRPMMASIASGGGIDPVTGQPDPALMQAFISDMMSFQLRMNIVYAALATVYFVACHGSMGQSLGKMLVGIRLVRSDGADPTYIDAFKRALAYPIAGLVPLVGGLASLLNGLWPLWDDKKQSIGDKIAKTQVVRA